MTEEEEPTDEGVGGAPMAKSGLYLDPNQAIRFLSGVKSQLFGETAPSPVVVPSSSTPEENDQSESLENTNSDAFDQTPQRKSPTPSTTSSTYSKSGHYLNFFCFLFVKNH